MGKSRLQSRLEPRYYSTGQQLGFMVCSDNVGCGSNYFWSKGVSMASGESENGLYDHLYRRFFKQRDTHEGYSFQHAPGGSAPTPVVTFREKLRWWTWDRRQRREKILAERDRLQREILQIKNSESS